MQNGTEKLSPLESSQALVETITKPMDWIDTLRKFLATNPTAQGIIQTIAKMC